MDTIFCIIGCFRVKYGIRDQISFKGFLFQEIRMNGQSNSGFVCDEADFMQDLRRVAWM